MHCWNMAKSTKLGRTARPWNTSTCWNTPLMQSVSLKKKKVRPHPSSRYSMVFNGHWELSFSGAVPKLWGCTAHCGRVPESHNKRITRGWSCGLLTRYRGTITMVISLCPVTEQRFGSQRRPDKSTKCRSFCRLKLLEKIGENHLILLIFVSDIYLSRLLKIQTKFGWQFGVPATNVCC